MTLEPGQNGSEMAAKVNPPLRQPLWKCLKYLANLICESARKWRKLSCNPLKSLTAKAKAKVTPYGGGWLLKPTRRVPWRQYNLNENR
jgi:hypothetical protein